MPIVTKASNEEIDDLIEIYLEKAKWLRSVNKTLWDETQFTREELTRKYINPEYYIGKIDTAIIGGFILIENDYQYWPEKPNDSAFYFHKFVIRNEYAGRGYSDDLIDWVKKHGKEKNKKYIRLDYDGNRKPITDLYTRNGFIPVEIVSNEYGKKLVKAEYIIE